MAGLSRVGFPTATLTDKQEQPDLNDKSGSGPRESPADTDNRSPRTPFGSHAEDQHGIAHWATLCDYLGAYFKNLEPNRHSLHQDANW